MKCIIAFVAWRSGPVEADVTYIVERALSFIAEADSGKEKTALRDLSELSFLFPGIFVAENDDAPNIINS
ncbi:MAG: hypothetical protein KBS73_01580, partial [Bacteroidales bacterium]|nr:hypothetical protein [Candidatus Cacconaster equifaecalis]